MKAIIPVAGYGTRLRPHTLSCPKALLPVAGKPILGHIIEQIETLGITEIVLVLGYLGSDIKRYVESHYSHLNFVYAEQKKLLGPGHAISLAKPFIRKNEKLLIMFGDTVFFGNIKEGMEKKEDIVLATKTVKDPRKFGVVKKNEYDKVVDVIEKPDYIKTMEVMVGIYFVNNSELLFNAFEKMIERQVKTKGEFYLTDGFKIALEMNASISTFEMEKWFDCGKLDTLLATNRYVLDSSKKIKQKHHVIDNGTIIVPPVFIGKNVKLSNSIVGPYVSVSDNAIIKSSIIKDSIINEEAIIENARLEQSFIGKVSSVIYNFDKLSVGDHSDISFSETLDS